MKVTTLASFLLCSLLCQNLSAQEATKNHQSLYGTWREKRDTVEEIKIISPTHVFFFVQGDKGALIATGAGAYSTKGNIYSEHLQYSNFDTKGIKADFEFEADGDQFRQKGILVLADGSQVPVNNHFSRVAAGAGSSGPQIGTWNQLSSSYLAGNGSRASHTNSTHIRYQIITPTHWMRISTANNQFENAFGGTYTMQGNKMIYKIDFASNPQLVGYTAELEQKLEGKRMVWAGVVKDAQGNKHNEIEDVFERVDQK